MPETEIFVSTDVETDGPIPGPHSMLSLGSVALNGRGEEIAAFAANLIELPDAAPHPRTKDWWESQPEAWGAARADARDPQAVMQEYDAWLRDLPTSRRPVFVAYPLLFDMMFVYWYQIRFVGESPFSFSGVDIKTMAWAAMRDRPYHSCTKRNMPRGWLSERRHTHQALDDAREQGELFMNVRRRLKLDGY